eukprot:TRINITY_DN15368_c0_g1_i1.p1 TRINITY_DN15368_c0_g1~~TRINITY_DN15368_c0_g1_i1.p1  ORF type:complete len:373 (-),score=119.21 TRINITY_DN15368_c0_g1_i1:83-1201(-)
MSGSSAEKRAASRSRSPRRKEDGAEGNGKGAEAACADEEQRPATVEELLAEAASLQAELPPDMDRALQLYEAALAQAPESAEVLDAFGAFLCEEGDVERARTLLERCAELSPDVGAEKFLYLAQMSSGKEALDFYERGATVLRSALAASSSSSSSSRSDVAAAAAPAVRRQLARLQASIGELFMTDLCDEADAEERCEAALASGKEADLTCLEVMATTANLRKVQGRLEEASEQALECARRVSKNLREQFAICEDEAQQGDVDVDVLADEDLVQLCRTLIDLKRPAEARGLLEVLLEKDEEDIQIWCLLGYCHAVEKDLDGLQECTSQALKLCKKLSKRDAMEWRSTIRDLMQRSKRLKAAGVPEDDAEVGE